MYKKLLFYIQLFSIFYFSPNWATNNGDTTVVVEVIDLTDEFKLNENEIKSLSDMALKGSKEAATKLYDHYEMYKNDFLEANFWLRIAAENGDTTAQYNYGIDLFEENYSHILGITDPIEIERRKKRAVFWFKKAATNGCKFAEEKLNEIEKELNNIN